MKVTLLSPYEIGRQPFALAQPTAWLKKAGFQVDCIDLSTESLDCSRIEGSKVVALHLAMHAGARLASQVIPRISKLKSVKAICVYGLYAPVNDEYFRSLGCEYVFGGEVEADLLALCKTIREKQSRDDLKITRNLLPKLDFVTPDRTLLPALDRYSRLVLAEGVSPRNVGFAETTRGCKHLCKHCPVVPVYGGKFRVIPVDVVLSDIEQQVAAGAEHISFGDPDFLNGPGHARRIIERLRSLHPQMTWDATIKVEHLLKYPNLLQFFAENGCLFITSAVESIEDSVLEKLDKGHTAEDFRQALALLRQLGIFMVPTFVPFTPWTTLEGYQHLLYEIAKLRLVSSIPPVQLSIRLLLPQGSKLLNAKDRAGWLKKFNSAMLGYEWRHPDPRVDVLQQQIFKWVMHADSLELDRSSIFRHIWTLTHQMMEIKTPNLEIKESGAVPAMTENWYCCAEPTTEQQLNLADRDKACTEQSQCHASPPNLQAAVGQLASS